MELKTDVLIECYGTGLQNITSTAFFFTVGMESHLPLQGTSIEYQNINITPTQKSCYHIHVNIACTYKKANFRPRVLSLSPIYRGSPMDKVLKLLFYAFLSLSRRLLWLNTRVNPIGRAGIIFKRFLK